MDVQQSPWLIPQQTQEQNETVTTSFMANTKLAMFQSIYYLAGMHIQQASVWLNLWLSERINARKAERSSVETKAVPVHLQ